MGPLVHPFDWLLTRRSLLAASVTTAVTVGIVVATDEATSTVPMRVARLAALSPLIAAVAALSVTEHARSRGELRAVECLGVAPWRAARGAALGALMVVVAGLALLVSPWADGASLFPAVRTAVKWSIDPDGRAARALGVVVSSDGAIALTAGVAAPHVALAAWAALPCLGPIALVVPAWAVSPMRHRSRAAAMGASGLLAVVLLHLVAAARVTPSTGVLAAFPLLVVTVWSRRSG